MNDEQLESALRRYQPRGPNASLRSRVLSGGAPAGVALRAIDWVLLTTAAVVLVSALVTVPSGHRPAPTPEEVAWRSEVVLVASTIEGDHALRIAETLVPRPAPQLPLELAPPMEPAPVAEAAQ